MLVKRQQMIEVGQLWSSNRNRPQLTIREKKAIAVMLSRLSIGEVTADLPDLTKEQLNALVAKLRISPDTHKRPRADVARVALRTDASPKAKAEIPDVPAFSLEEPYQHPLLATLLDNGYPVDLLAFQIEYEKKVSVQKVKTAKSVKRMRTLHKVGYFFSCCLIGIPCVECATERLVHLHEVQKASKSWRHGLSALKTSDWERAAACFESLVQDEEMLRIFVAKSLEEACESILGASILTREAEESSGVDFNGHGWLIGTAYINAALKKIKDKQGDLEEMDLEEIRADGVKACAYLLTTPGRGGYLFKLGAALAKTPEQVTVT